MPTYDVGVPVEFPYEAYGCQLDYMRAVVRALDGGQNALLESPTGTGKTLCLLCAALAWRRAREGRYQAQRASWEAQMEEGANAPVASCPRIWYASRTHSQLKQVVQELKRTSYKPSSVVLGSREHFCIHASVSRHTGAKQNALCKRARDENRCPFYTGLRKHGGKVKTSCLDIEEIVTSCKESGICPFYKTREEAKEAELLLIPYDYLINPQTRESLQVSLKGSVLIFDEGHNIERSCESAASFELRTEDLAMALGEIDDARELLGHDPAACEEVLGDFTVEQFAIHLDILKKHLMALEDTILGEFLQKDPTTNRLLTKRPGSYILDLVSKNSGRGEGIHPKDFKHICMVVRKAIAVLTLNMDNLGSGGHNLDKLQSLIATAFRAEAGELDKCYQVLVYEDTADEMKRGAKRKSVDFFSDLGKKENVTPRTLCLWCFSGSVAMKELQDREVHSVIITSGTLSPLEGTAEAFGVPFPVCLENSHVIDARKQVWGGVLCSGPENVSLDASFTQRNEPAYIKDLGSALAAVAGHVPDGVLLAFQSYAMKENVLRSWRQTGLMQEIEAQKPLFDEPKGNMEMKVVFERYNDALKGKSGRGAILAAVCRGKLCEGIDFTDKQCRMVVLVGIPFPSRNDLHVLTKQSFLDSRGIEGDGRRWYNREAVRAVNQTLGRVIRHKQDFGAVLLCDARFAREDHLSYLGLGISQWLRPSLSVLPSFNSALEGCRSFFARTAGVLPPKPKPVPPTPATTASATVPGEGKSVTSANATAAPSVQPTGAAAAATPGAAAASVAGAAVATGGRTGLSALSAFWSRTGLKKKPADEHTVALPGNAKQDGHPTPGSKKAATVAQQQRAPATPQAPRQAASGSSAKESAAQATPSPAPVAPAAPPPAKRPSILGKIQEGLLDPEAWLKNAEALLPRVEQQQARQHLELILDNLEQLMDNRGGDEKQLQASLRAVAELLLPVFSFDLPADELRRRALIKDCGMLLPKIFRPMWKSNVVELLKSRGEACTIW